MKGSTVPQAKEYRVNYSRSPIASEAHSLALKYQQLRGAGDIFYGKHLLVFVGGLLTR